MAKYQDEVDKAIPLIDYGFLHPIPVLVRAQQQPPPKPWTPPPPLKKDEPPPKPWTPPPPPKKTG